MAYVFYKKKIINQILAYSMLIFMLFFAGSIAAYDSAEVFSPQSSGVELPVLMYHHLTASPDKVGEYTLAVDRFEEDLKFLKNQGYTSITTQQLIDFIDGKSDLPEKPVYITFDDGYRSFFVYAVPLLQKYDMYAVVNIVGAYTDEATKTDDDNVNYAYLDWQEVKEIADSQYCDIGNHTYNMHNHTERKGCSMMEGESIKDYKTALIGDIGEFQNQILYNTDRTPRVFAYPFGSFSEQSVEILDEIGFDILLCSEQRMNLVKKGQGGAIRLCRFNMTPEKNAFAVLEVE